jgi:hypothetical protein
MRLMQLWLGAAGVQRLIDAGVYITWVEKNGLEMLAEFTREVTGSRKQTSSFTATRVRFLFLCTRVCVCVSNVSEDSFHMVMSNCIMFNFGKP